MPESGKRRKADIMRRVGANDLPQLVGLHNAHDRLGVTDGARAGEEGNPAAESGRERELTLLQAAASGGGVQSAQARQLQPVRFRARNCFIIAGIGVTHDAGRRVIP